MMKCGKTFPQAAACDRNRQRARRPRRLLRRPSFRGSEKESALSHSQLLHLVCLRGPKANENISHWKPVADREWLAGGFYWTGFDYKGEPSPSQWPAISSHFGIFDLCGFPKDNYYYYKAWWTKTPWSTSCRTGTGLGQKEGQPMRVVIFGNTEQVELLLNGKSLGMQKMPPNESLEWQVPYVPGRLEARGIQAAG